jgi:hypothetical protein
MNIDRSVWTTMVLGPYDGDVKTCTFPILPQVKTGRVKVLPRPANLGPPDPNVDDTMSTVSWMDLTGGQGIAVINPASDLSRTWFSTADTRYTDGWTNPPEIRWFVPDGTWDMCIPFGRIGISVYALWIDSGLSVAPTVHQWDPDAQEWNATSVTFIMTTVSGMPWCLPSSEEAMTFFNGSLFVPISGFPVAEEGFMVTPMTGGSGGDFGGPDHGPGGPSSSPPHLGGAPIYTGFGYIRLYESAPGVIASTFIAGAAVPIYSPDIPLTTTPTPRLFGVHQQKLWALTGLDAAHPERSYTLCTSLTGLANDWFWPLDTSRGTYVRLERTLTPYQLLVFPDPTGGEKKLWVSTDKGMAVYDSNETSWVESQLWDVPPHPDFGKTAQVFRPGEAIWVASGGGDLVKLTANGVVAPASGPGGAGNGLPTARRGSVVSMATDLANLYVLLSKRIDSGYHNLTLIAGTGVGWHPLWSIDDADTTDRGAVVRVAAVSRDDDTIDYRAFWSVGAAMYSMPLRLEMYSSRQGHEAGIDRFSETSYIELGEFNAGAIATEKLASHAAILLDDCPDGCSVSLSYQIQSDDASTWHELGTATVAHARTVLPFGLSGDGLWSEGLPFYWIKLKLTLVGLGGTTTPVVRALTLSYLPLPQDAATLTFTVPLPITTDADTDLTAEQIRDRLIGYVTSREFLQLTFQDKTYRVYCASATTSTIAPRDTLGSLALVVIQINTGDPSLRGESP